MFASLTRTEQAELFIRLSHAHRAIDRRMGDLIPAPDEKWQPVAGLGAEIVTLMHDLNNAPAAPEAWQRHPAECNCGGYGTCEDWNAVPSGARAE